MSANELLHQPVFERVKTDGHEPPARREQIERLRQRALDLAELIVDVDAQRLEGARRRMLAGFARTHYPRHQRRKLGGPLERLGVTRAHDLACDRGGEAFLTVARDHVAHLIAIRPRQPCGNWLAARRVHAHIERTVLEETE